jgi:hypothetical protein
MAGEGPEENFKGSPFLPFFSFHFFLFLFFSLVLVVFFLVAVLLGPGTTPNQGLTNS